MEQQDQKGAILEYAHKATYSQVWRCILGVRHNFCEYFIYKIKDGTHISFFNNNWLSNLLLGEELAPHIRSMVGPNSAWLSAFIRRVNWTILWSSDNSLLQLWQQISDVQLFLELHEDTLRWRCNDRENTIKQGYQILNDERSLVTWSGLVWHKMGVPRFSVWVWQLFHRKLATQENLKIHGRHLASRCSICKLQEESTDHLFVTCTVAT